MVNIQSGVIRHPNNDYYTYATCSPFNPYCLTDGRIPFDFTPPLPQEYFLDPPPELCVPTMTADMWFEYIATCTGELTVETCGANAQTSPDTNLIVYDGCECPPNPTTLLACSDDEGGACGNGSRAKVDVIEGQCYKIRLGDSAQNLPDGVLTIGCVQKDCPAGLFTFVDPPDDVVDAGQAQLTGIQTITVEGVPSAQADCFNLCETAVAGTENSIAALIEGPPRRYTLELARSITANAKTTITYTDHHGQATRVRLVAHPGNVNADQFITMQDLAHLRGALAGTHSLPFGLYSGDIDRSGKITAADLLAFVDIWNGFPQSPPVPNPINDPACP